MHSKIKVGITQGDINGIGYEVILKTFSDSRMFDDCVPILYGSPKFLLFYKKLLNLDSVPCVNIKNSQEAQAKKLNVINIMPDEEARVNVGISTPFSEQGVINAITQATSDIKNNAIDVLVTAPFNKLNVLSNRFPYAGHTQYLAEKFECSNPLMLLVNEGFRVGLVTEHIPLADVATKITKELLTSKVIALHKSLREDFGISHPKIAVLGLNPHAGDGGVIGKEEAEIIIPAMKNLFDDKILVFGPFASCGFFGAQQHTKYDGILAMYHDQGLAPFKIQSFEEGVNFTAGLSIIRTSPAHGTAYDIAGKNIASPSSFRKAVFLACDIYKTRKLQAEITKNPLPLSRVRASNRIE